MTAKAQGIERARHLYEWEKTRREKYTYLAGVDEVGRGPMAGPVVAAAVILPSYPQILGIDDSKKLSAAKRELLFDNILDVAVAIGIGIRSNRFIDEKGIAPATVSAMRLAVKMLVFKGFTPDLVLVDGYEAKHLGFRQEAVVKADALSASVAAASIIAKVTRDRIMRHYELLYPSYGFSSHKGYYTPLHRKCLREFGPSPIHRKSFRPISGKLNNSLDEPDGKLF